MVQFQYEGDPISLFFTHKEIKEKVITVGFCFLAMKKKEYKVLKEKLSIEFTKKIIKILNIKKSI